MWVICSNLKKKKKMITKIEGVKEKKSVYLNAMSEFYYCNASVLLLKTKWWKRLDLKKKREKKKSARAAHNPITFFYERFPAPVCFCLSRSVDNMDATVKTKATTTKKIENGTHNYHGKMMKLQAIGKRTVTLYAYKNCSENYFSNMEAAHYFVHIFLCLLLFQFKCKTMHFSALLVNL